MAIAELVPEVLAGVYVRISSDDDPKIKNLGVKRQEVACRALIDAQGWTLVDVYCDNNRSASKEQTHRPEFERLLADLRSGRINKIVVLSQDRLLRKPEELESTIRLLRKLGIRHIQTVTDGVVDVGSTTGRTMARVKSTMDIGYAEFISEKVQQKKAELAQRGLPSGGGPRAFGYDAGGMKVRRDEAKLVRSAAKRVLAGDSLRSVVREWTDRGITGTTGRPFSANQLRTTLVSRRLAGIREHHGEVVGDAAWPAVLDRATHERLRAMLLAANRRREPMVRSYLLTGFLVCGRCGRKLVARKNNGKRGYSCVDELQKGGCGRLTIVADPLEALIVDMVFTALDSPKFDAAMRKRGERHDGGEDVAAKIVADEQKLEQLAKDYADDIISRGEWLTARKGLSDRVEANRRRLTTTQADTRLDLLSGGAATLRRNWKSMGLDRKRAVISAIIDHIVVQPVAVRGRHEFDEGRVVDTVVWRF